MADWKLRARAEMEKKLNRAKQGILWKKFKENSRGLLLATTLIDVASNTTLIGLLFSNWEGGLAGLYGYAFVKDLLLRPLQGLCALELELRAVKLYVGAYYLLNAGSLLTYPVLPIESYISAAFNLKGLRQVGLRGDLKIPTLKDK